MEEDEKKEVSSPTIIIILKKMCEYAEKDYDNINWTDGSHLKITYPRVKMFVFSNWLTDHIYNMTIKELNALVGDNAGRFYYKRKKKAVQLAMEFTQNLGFACEKVKINKHNTRKNGSK